MPDTYFFDGSPGLVGLRAPAVLLLHHCHWRSGGLQAVPASGLLHLTQAEVSLDRKPQLTCRQDKLGATLVLQLLCTHFLPQSPKESGPVRVGAINRPVGLIGTFRDDNFLLSFGHTFSSIKRTSTESVPQCPLVLTSSYVGGWFHRGMSTLPTLDVTLPSIISILIIFPQVSRLVGLKKMLTLDRNLSILRRFSRCSSWAVG